MCIEAVSVGSMSVSSAHSQLAARTVQTRHIRWLQKEEETSSVGTSRTNTQQQH